MNECICDDELKQNHLIVVIVAAFPLNAHKAFTVN